MLYYQILVSTKHEKMFKKWYKNNKSKIPRSTLDEEFELPYGWYFVLDIQKYFGFIIKKTWNTV